MVIIRLPFFLQSVRAACIIGTTASCRSVDIVYRQFYHCHYKTLCLTSVTRWGVTARNPSQHIVSDMITTLVFVHSFFFFPRVIINSLTMFVSYYPGSFIVSLFFFFARVTLYLKYLDCCVLAWCLDVIVAGHRPITNDAIIDLTLTRACWFYTVR